MLMDTTQAQFFFVFGSSKKKQPFAGGWVRVFAPTRLIAEQKFLKQYPQALKNGSMSCDAIYASADFLRTGLLCRGNLGAYCHQTIR